MKKIVLWDLTNCNDENKIIAINKILNNKLNNLSVAFCKYICIEIYKNSYYIILNKVENMIGDNIKISYV